MNVEIDQETQRVSRTHDLPAYVHHESFKDPKAATIYSPNVCIDGSVNYDSRHMPDEVTRDYAQRMHYAAHRMHQAKRSDERGRWGRYYIILRDRIVLGNRKLVYRAVRQRMKYVNRADDMIGECHIVLIQAVAAFNPWMKIRFSTYTYTCLIRALSRQSQKISADWLSRAMSLDATPVNEPRFRPTGDELVSSGSMRIDEFLKLDHPLLSDREKVVISRRFYPDAVGGNPTLAMVGRDLGLSKERVRQVQASALEKLRKVLVEQST